METNRRREDGLSYKIKYMGGIAGALLAISAAIFAVTDTRYQTKAAAMDCERVTSARISKAEQDISNINIKLDYIKDGIAEIKEAVKK